MRPAHRIDVIFEVLAAFFEVGKIFVRQILYMLTHVILGQLDKKSADAIADAARAAVEHEPNLFVFIQADFDKMITGAERTEMIHVITAIELRVFINYRFVTDLELAPHTDLPLRELAPCSPIAAPAVVRAPVRHCLLDRRANPP